MGKAPRYSSAGVVKTPGNRAPSPIPPLREPRLRAAGFSVAPSQLNMGQHEGTDDWNGLPSINSILDDIATTHSGLAFIYSALDTLASRYEIDDAIIVLKSNSLGAQMFRLEGKSISAELANELRFRPGVFCTPDVVPRDDLDAVYAACQRSLSSKVEQFGTTRENAISLNTSKVRFDELKPLSSRLRTKLTESMTTSRNLTVVSRRGTETLRAKRTRAYISQFLIVIDIVVLIMAVAGVHGPVRLLLGLIFGVIVPGWSIVGLLRLDNAALEFGLTVAVSLSLLMIAAQVMMAVDLWHLVAFEEVTCAGCLPFLWIQSRGQRRLGQHSRQ